MLEFGRGPKYRAVPVQTGQQSFRDGNKKPINTSATSTPKSVKHQESKGSEQLPREVNFERIQGGSLRTRCAGMRVDLIEIDDAMRVITQGWRSMSGKSMHGKLEAGRIMGDSIVDILFRVHLVH